MDLEGGSHIKVTGGDSRTIRGLVPLRALKSKITSVRGTVVPLKVLAVKC